MTPLYGHAHDLHTLEPYYSRHVSAMTTERLHAKSDIAAELAWRDKALADAVALLTPCKTCGEPATRGYPTAEIGYYVFGCDEHRQGPEHDEDSDGHAFDMKQAPLVRSLKERARHPEHEKPHKPPRTIDADGAPLHFGDAVESTARRHRATVGPIYEDGTFDVCDIDVGLFPRQRPDQWRHTPPSTSLEGAQARKENP